MKSLTAQPKSSSIAAGSGPRTADPGLLWLKLRRYGLCRVPGALALVQGIGGTTVNTEHGMGWLSDATHAKQQSLKAARPQQQFCV
jgi:hypothetical protein